MLDKTVGRTTQFIGGGLALRDEARLYVPLIYGLVAEAVWLLASLVGEPHWFSTAAGGCALFCLLAAVCAIDARFGIIPDSLVVALAIGGGLETMVTGAADPIRRAGEAGIMLVAAWLFRFVYFRIRGFHGLGLGDVKLAAAGVLWTGLAPVPPIILVAAASALVSVGLQRAQGDNISSHDAIAFGPHLALGIWVVWIGSNAPCCDWLF